jgi:hypothetical protein
MRCISLAKEAMSKSKELYSPQKNYKKKSTQPKKLPVPHQNKEETTKSTLAESYNAQGEVGGQTKTAITADDDAWPSTHTITNSGKATTYDDG